MSPRSTKIVRISGIALLVLVNIAAILFAAPSIWMSYKYDVYNPCLAIGMGCGYVGTYTDWNIIILNILYIVAMLISLAIAIKKGHRAWLYNILILGLGPLSFFLYLYPPF
jgi:hypothetical protein